MVKFETETEKQLLQPCTQTEYISQEVLKLSSISKPAGIRSFCPYMGECRLEQNSCHSNQNLMSTDVIIAAVFVTCTMLEYYIIIAIYICLV